MTIQDVYEYLDTPLNLQTHMLRVAGLVQELATHWEGGEVDWDTLTQAALLHDVGNVIKFDLVKFPHLLGSEQNRLGYWRRKQEELIKRYGDDDHAATKQMLSELQIPIRTRQLIAQKSFGNAKTVSSSTDMLPKILLYADLRILPDGLGTLVERLVDVKIRLPKYSTRPDFSDLVTACESIEEEIRANINTPIENFINKQAIDYNKDKLLAMTTTQI